MAEWEAIAAAELARLTPPHDTKKRATIIALVDARLAGTSQDLIFDRPECCSRAVYHGKWKKDPVFADVLKNVAELAINWKSEEDVCALREAARRLYLASPVAVSRMIDIITTGQIEFKDRNGYVVRTAFAQMPEVVRAAFGILDRAGVETAVKLKQETDVVFTESESALDRINRRMASLATRIGTPSPVDGTGTDSGGAESA